MNDRVGHIALPYNFNDKIFKTPKKTRSSSISHQIQFFQLFSVSAPAFHGVNSGRVDAGVPQDIRETNYILGLCVERAREKMPEIMRENFLGAYLCNRG